MKASTPLALVLLASTALLPLSAHAQAKPGAPTAASTTAAEDQRLLAFLDKAFDEAAALSPETLTNLGLKENYDKLDDYTDAQNKRELDLSERQLAQMKAQFDPARLGPQARLSYRLFEEAVVTERENYRWRWYSFPISTNGTPAGDIPVFLINQHRVDTVADAQAYIARIRDTERVMKEIAANVRQQAAQGIVPPRMVFAPARNDAKEILEGAPFAAGEDSTVLADFKAKVGKLDAPAATKAKLITDAQAALTGPFKRGYDSFFALLDEVEPKATSNDCAWRLPEGGAYYNSRLGYYTTTDLTADQIHALGLAQVKAIHAEMEAIKAQVGFKGTLQEFFVQIRTDPRFKYPNSEAGKQQYLTDARSYIAQAMTAAPRFFHRLPKAALEVRAVEPFREQTASVAFYERPAPDGSRPGIFYVNLANMDQVQKVQAEGIAHHEGAPGHHFQIARAQELEGLPKFRKYGYYGAYIEGWGLYTERLAGEMGAYKDPYSQFGMLGLQLWRAIRLVTDTGLHSKRWTREQAVAYFKDNSPIGEADINREVNRYINNPGQATSYMVGQLRINALREKAEKALGPKFDIRDFHEVVLANGAVPLNVLEELVDQYIARIKGA